MRLFKLTQLALILAQLFTGQPVDKSDSFYIYQKLETIKQYQSKYKTKSIKV